MAQAKKKVKRERERPERRLDWRFLVLVLILALVGVVAWKFNAQFEGMSVYKFRNALTVDDGDEKIDWGRYPVYEVDLAAGSVAVTKAGTYHLTGVLEDGVIYVDVKNTEAKLVLDNVTIRNSAGPAIYVDQAEDVVIEVVGNNYVEDGKVYEGYAPEVNGAIYSRQDLTFQGDGALTVVGQKADGIVSKDDLKFISGFYNVTAKDDGVRGTDSVRVTGGELVIAAGEDAIKVTNGERDGKGFALIEGGVFDLTSGGKGIEAVEMALIRGGEFKISANEGIEARRVIIDGGKLDITAIDDGLNAKSDYGRECLIYIAGGETEVYSSGDGLDSNGNILITGGILTINVPKHDKNEPLDASTSVTISEAALITIIER